MRLPTGLLNTLHGLEALATSEVLLDLSAVAARNAAMVRELPRFSFPDIAAVAGGLLTYPDNQPATFRLEALVSLAAVHAKGVDRPSSADFARWLNGSLLSDPIGQLESPVEDVFVSNVPSWNGNARLFDGLWGDNDGGVAALVWSTMRLQADLWAAKALDECMALLDLSEAIAERCAVERYTMSEGQPKSAIDVSPDRLDEARARVTFHVSELLQMRLEARRIAPFGMTAENQRALAGQAIGNTGLERRPLIRDGLELIVAMPTALGAAIRRHVLEAASAAGAVSEVERVIADMHFAELHGLGLTGFKADMFRQPEAFGTNCRDLVATFDEGSYLHLVYVGEALDDVRGKGLRSLHDVPTDVAARVSSVAADVAGRHGYQRGLTVVVHGGVGRGFRAELDNASENWRRVGIEIGDLARIYWEHGFDALRLWKILDQEEQLPELGYELRNINGFTNLYGFLRGGSMAIVPDSAAPGVIQLASNHVGALRGHLRQLLDPHVAIGPGRSRWVEVQRSATDVFFEEVKGLPLFVDRTALLTGVLASSVETDVRPWWVSLERGQPGPVGLSIVHQLWDMVQNWMVRAAPLLEQRFPGLPDGPMSIELTVPDVDAFETDAANVDPFGPPRLSVDGASIALRCGNDYLNSFARSENVGDRFMVATIARGAAKIAGEPLTQAEAEAFAVEVIGSPSARFFHMFQPRSPSMLVHSAAGLGRPRLLQEEDIAWGRLQLALDAGWSEGPGPIPLDRAPAVLKAATVALLSRIQALMEQLDREALVARVLYNHDAVAWDRFNWQQTAAALLALYRDQADVVGASNHLEMQRGITGLASRVLAEMAICIAPATGGRKPTDADLDRLHADLAIMIECANQDDAIHWGLTAVPPVVNENGSFTFDDTFRKGEQTPYINAHGERAFRSAARSYARNFEPRGTPAELQADPAFLAAIIDEYGIDLLGLARFTTDLAHEAAAAQTTLLRLRRSEVIKRLRGDPDDFPAEHAEKAFDALALKPRARWDEDHPEGAKKRDWYPWRFSRRLSLVHRPLVQIDEGNDPIVLVAPTLMDHFVIRLLEAEQGLVPVEQFTGAAMRSWIGAAVNRDGHEFNRTVAAGMRGLGWSARSDVKLTELGGTKEMGDVDVLAWHEPSSTIIAIECKRLQIARSIGEIGERLAEYTTIAPPKVRKTPIQKHLLRIAFLQASPSKLAKLTRISVDQMTLRSGLVTDHLVPMLFSGKAASMVDVITEFGGLADALPTPASA